MVWEELEDYNHTVTRYGRGEGRWIIRGRLLVITKLFVIAETITFFFLTIVCFIKTTNSHSFVYNTTTTDDTNWDIAHNICFIVIILNSEVKLFEYFYTKMFCSTNAVNVMNKIKWFYNSNEI